MITGIDHIVIMVGDLEQAAEQWGNVGFNVIRGGKHPRGTHNALIAFQDSSYLELIAFWEPDYDAHRWHRFQNSGIGLIDHALASSNLAREVQDVNERGVPYSGPHPGARSRPDGVELEWRTAHAEGIDDHRLPFLIDDITARELRVPTGVMAKHENGVQGVDRLQLVVSDLASDAADYRKVVDAEDDDIECLSIGQPSQCASVAVGRHIVELHEPAGEGDASARLNGYGAGPMAVRFFGTTPFDIDPEKLDGARISCVSR
jgi:hypothetical protein